MYGYWLLLSQFFSPLNLGQKRRFAPGTACPSVRKECLLLKVKLQYPTVQWHLPQLQPGKRFAPLRYSAGSQYSDKCCPKARCESLLRSDLDCAVTTRRR